MSTPSRFLLTCLVVAVALVAASCGGDSDSSDSSGASGGSAAGSESSGGADSDVVIDETSSAEALAAATVGTTGDDLPQSDLSVEGVDACDVLSAEPVESFLGSELVEPLSSGGGTDCTYTTAENSLAVIRSLALDADRACVNDGWQPLNIGGNPAALRPDLRVVVCLSDSNLELQYVGSTDGIDVPGGLVQLATLAIAKLG